MDNVVELRSITKRYPGIVANDDITLTLRKGEIHALLGENGAGKTTLMRILFGLTRPDSGTILVRGKPVTLNGPEDASALGIGMVHQHFRLVAPFTVTENIILGTEPPLLHGRKAAEKIAAFSHQFGLGVDPDAVISQSSVSVQQRTEILKMLYRDADILIFDEPTAVLTPQEAAELMRIMHRLAERGKSILLITHKLNEIKSAASRCTVLRRGKVIGTVNVSETNEETLAGMMVGRDVTFALDKPSQTPGGIVLETQNLTVQRRRRTTLEDVSFMVREGEIVGVAGIDGNGQTELVEAITGLRRVKSGKIWLGGHEITRMSVRDRLLSGIAHIPEDRQLRGLVLDFSLEDNMKLALYDQPPFAQHGLIRRDAARQYADKIIQEFDVRASAGSKTPARALSGGNQQKAIIGREMERLPRLLIAVHPTRGLDIGSASYIHRRLLELRWKGHAILLVSLDLDEILNLSDRIAVLSGGRLAATVNTAETDENKIGLMMAGRRAAHEA